MDFLKTTHEEERIYQWDVDKVLEIIPPSGYEVKEVHFQHCNAKDAYVLEVYEEAGVKLVKIPNILLKSSAPIKAWLTDGERTICGQILTVISRAKPDDYVYTETEVKRYETLEKRIEELEKGGNVDLTEIEADITELQEDVSQLSKDVADLKENGTGNVGTDFGGVEITDGEPTKETTVMTLNPNAEEVHLYTAEEIDAKFDALVNGNEVAY